MRNPRLAFLLGVGLMAMVAILFAAGIAGVQFFANGTSLGTHDAMAMSADAPIVLEGESSGASASYTISCPTCGQGGGAALPSGGALGDVLTRTAGTPPYGWALDNHLSQASYSNGVLTMGTSGGNTIRATGFLQPDGVVTAGSLSSGTLTLDRSAGLADVVIHGFASGGGADGVLTALVFDPDDRDLTARRSVGPDIISNPFPDYLLSVSTNDITNAAITSAKLANDSVTEDKLADGSVGIDALQTASVTMAKIAPGAVRTAQIHDESIIPDDLNSDHLLEQYDFSHRIGALPTDGRARTVLTDATLSAAALATRAVGYHAGEGGSIQHSDGTPPPIVASSAAGTINELVLINATRAVYIEFSNSSFVAPTGWELVIDGASAPFDFDGTGVTRGTAGGNVQYTFPNSNATLITAGADVRFGIVVAGDIPWSASGGMGLQSVSSDATLAGLGTDGSPLRVANPWPGFTQHQTEVFDSFLGGGWSDVEDNVVAQQLTTSPPADATAAAALTYGAVFEQVGFSQNQTATVRIPASVEPTEYRTYRVRVGVEGGFVPRLDPAAITLDGLSPLGVVGAWQYFNVVIPDKPAGEDIYVQLADPYELNRNLVNVDDIFPPGGTAGQVLGLDTDTERVWTTPADPQQVPERDTLPERPWTLGERFVNIAPSALTYAKFERVVATSPSATQRTVDVPDTYIAAIHCYSGTYITGNLATQTALRGKCFVITAGAPTTAQRVKTVQWTDGSDDVATYSVASSPLVIVSTPLPHWYEISGLTYAVLTSSLSSGAYYNLIRNDDSKLFADGSVPMRDVSWNGSDWIITPGVVPAWVTDPLAPVPLGKLPHYSSGEIFSGDCDCGISVTNASANALSAHRGFDPVFDMDDADKNSGAFLGSIRITMSGASTPHLGFDTAGSKSIDVPLDTSLVSVLLGTAAYDAGAGEFGERLSATNVYNNNTIIGQVRFSLDRDGGDVLGRNALWAAGASAGSESFSIQITLYLIFVRQEGATGLVVETLVDYTAVATDVDNAKHSI